MGLWCDSEGLQIIQISTDFGSEDIKQVPNNPPRKNDWSNNNKIAING